MKISKRLLVFNTIWFMTTPPLAIAESIGTHCWQQAPFDHILCFDVNNLNGQYFSLTGENIADNNSYPIYGSALFDEGNNVFRLSFTQNLGDAFVFENAVTLDPTTLSGNWTDDGGNSGEFQYLGVGPIDTEKVKAITTPRQKTPRKKAK